MNDTQISYEIFYELTITNSVMVRDFISCKLVRICTNEFIHRNRSQNHNYEIVFSAKLITV
jgi:hypothetical protein